VSAETNIVPMTRRLRRVSVELVRSGSTSFPLDSRPITSMHEIVQAANAILRTADRENMLVFHLNHKYVINAYEVVGVGTTSAVLVHPREVFKSAILSNASAIALAHNHPSGDPGPSQDDLVLTRRILEASKILGIELLDHVIIGHENYVSLRETTKLWLPVHQD
jgi:DNA repair protein RadC